MSGPIRIWNDQLGAGDFGTLGCLVRKGGRVAVLTAAHVTSPLWRGVHYSRFPDVTIDIGGKVLPGRVDRWLMPLNGFGHTSPDTPDAALVIVSPDDEDALVRATPLPSGLSDCRNGTRVRFLGASTRQVLRSTIQDDFASVLMQYPLYTAAGLRQYVTATVQIYSTIQVDADLSTEGGDSGGLLFDTGGEAAGLLIGTDPAGRYRYFSRLPDVLVQFGAALLTHADVPSAGRLADLA